MSLGVVGREAAQSRVKRPGGVGEFSWSRCESLKTFWALSSFGCMAGSPTKLSYISKDVSALECFFPF